MTQTPFKIRNGFNSNTDNFVVTDTGVAINKATPTTDLDVNGNIKTVDISLQSNFLVGSTAITGSTNATAVDSFDIDDYHTVKYVVAVETANGNERQMAEVLLVVDKTANSGAGDAYISTYGLLFSGADAIASFSSDVSGGDARLLVTCTSAGCIVKAQKTATYTGAGGSASSSEVSFGLSDLDNVSLSSVSTNQVLQWDGSSWVNATFSAGSTTFAALTDGPGALTANKWVKVNSAGSALEYVDAPATATQGSNADTAYGWGDHDSAGYVSAATSSLGHSTAIPMAINGSTILSLSASGIIPEQDNQIDLGSPTKMFRHVYVGSGSLYIDGTKVMGSDEDTINISADVNQNISIQTSGSGDIELDPTGTGVVQLKGNVVQDAGATFSAASGEVTFNSPIDMDSRKIVNLTTPTAGTDAANKAYVDAEITTLIGGSPGALDTLNELAAALGDDASYATTITNALAAKADSSSVPSTLGDLSGVSIGSPSDGQVLTYDSSSGAWEPAASAGGDTSNLTTKGDLEVYTTSATRLAVGTNGQVLTADSSAASGLAWADAASGGATYTSSGTAPTSPSNNDTWYDTGDNILYKRVADGAGTGIWLDISSTSGGANTWSRSGDNINYADGNVGIGESTPTHPIHMGSGAHCTSGGVWTNASSRSLKKNIKDLTQKDADAAFAQLEPKSYQYKAGSQHHLGFIAEDVHDLVATEDRKGLAAMDIVAVLTKVMKKQQKQIAKLEKALLNK